MINSSNAIFLGSHEKCFQLEIIIFMHMNALLVFKCITCMHSLWGQEEGSKFLEMEFQKVVNYRVVIESRPSAGSASALTH